MATISVVNRRKQKVRQLYSIREMKASIVHQTHTQEDLQKYYDADDNLDLSLDKYYADSLMFMQVQKPELYNLYIDMSKESVKAKMLRQIVADKQKSISYQLTINRISNLKSELKNIKDKKRNRKKVSFIKRNINRLETWAKDLNYESKNGAIKYKETKQ